MNIAGLDIFFLVIIAGMSILGLISGFVKEFFSKAAVFLGLLIAILFFKRFSAVLSKSISSVVLAQIMSFLIIFLVVYLLIKILQRLIGSIFENETMKGLDRALGFFFGILEGFVIVGVIIAILSVQTFIDVSAITKDSFFIHFLQPLLPAIGENINQVDNIIENTSSKSTVILFLHRGINYV